MKGMIARIMPILMLSTLWATAYAQTQVPNEFQAGQPARASEVNENFDILEQAVQQLEGETSSTSGQVKTAIPLASEARWLVDDYYRKHGALPATNADAGALFSADTANNFVTGVSINNGNVVATFGNNADLAIAGGSLEFVANTNVAGVYFTCNASANVAAHFDQDSCVFVDEPPEPVSTIRKQFKSAITLASEVRWLVEDYFRHTFLWATINSEAAAAPADRYVNAFVESVNVEPGGVVTATFGNQAPPQLHGYTVSFIATWNSGSIDWTCRSTVADRYSRFTNGRESCLFAADKPPLPVTLMWQWVESGLPLALNLQSLVVDYRQASGVWPTSNADIGAPAPSTIVNAYVSGVAVGPAGVVTISYQGPAHSHLLPFAVTLIPTDNGGSISWMCTSPDPDKRYLPLECRG